MRENTYTERGKLEPKDEQALERKVPGEVVQDGAEGEALEEVEEAEDDPVSEPLNVVVVAGALDGPDGEERGEGPAEQVRNGRCERVDRVEETEERDTAEEDVRLRDLCALL